MALLTARQNLQKAQEQFAETAFALRDVREDARLAMERMASVGVAPITWSEFGEKLVSAWVAELMPAPEKDTLDAMVFTLPPPAHTSDGG